MHDAAAYAMQTRRNQRTMEVLAAVLASLPPEPRRHSVLLVSRGYVDLSESPLYQDALLALQRSQAALYFLDLRLTGPADFSAQHTAPHREADEADLLQRHLGRPVRATGEWLSAESGGTRLGRADQDLARFVEEARGYYLLGYEPMDPTSRPGFRRITIDIARPGLRVRARRGYDPAAGVAVASGDTALRQALQPPPPPVLAAPTSDLTPSDARSLRSAAVGHLEAAAAARAQRKAGEAKEHLANGDRLAARAAALDARKGEPTLKDWLLASGWLLMNAAGAGDQAEAQQRLERAQRLAPADAQVALALGMLHEALALRRARELGLAADRWADLGRVRLASGLRVDDPLAREARAAEQLFRKALAADPGLDEARLRLARVLEFRRKDRQAAQELERVAASSAVDVWASLAHLFLGDMEERAGRSERALARYRAAFARLPGAQSVRVALSQALLRAGAEAEAAAVIRAGLESGMSASPHQDGWVAYCLSPSSRFLAAVARMRAAGPS